MYSCCMVFSMLYDAYYNVFFGRFWPKSARKRANYLFNAKWALNVLFKAFSI